MNKTISEKVGIVTAGNGIKFSLSVLFGMILARLISKYDMGTYRQLFLLYSTLAPIFLIGIPTSIYYFIPRLGQEKRKEFIFQTINLLVMSGFLFSVFTFISAGYISHYFNNPVLEPLLRIFSLYPFFAISVSYLPMLAISVGKHKVSSVTVVLTELVLNLSIIIPLLLGYDLKTAFASAVVFSSLMFLIIILYTVKTFGRWEFKLNSKSLKEQFTYSIPIGMSYIIGLLGRKVDQIVISMFYLANRFAVYSIGAVEIPVIEIFSSSINTVFLPEFSRLYTEKQNSQIISLWHKGIKKVALLAMPIFVLLFVLARHLLVLLYTNLYAESTSIFRIYLFLLPLRIATYSVILQGAGYTKPIFIGAVIFLLLNTVLNVVFIKWIGFAGPALATILCTYLLCFYYLLKDCEVLECKLGEILPWKDITRIFSVAVFSGCFVYPLSSLENPIPVIIMVSGIYLSVYTALSYKLKIIENEDFYLIARMLGLKRNHIKGTGINS